MKKLLVVDDDAAIRRLIRRVVEELGHEVTEVSDGTDALDLIRRSRPDLVLIDMHMPRLDGITTLEAILEIHPGMGVIMITGDGDGSRAKTAMERGACDFLSKPFDAEYLKTSVEANLIVRS